MRTRSSMWRGIAVLAVVVLGAAVASPAFSAFTATKGKIKKLATKQIKKVGPGLFIEEDELVRFGPISLSATSPDQTIGTFGPFTLTAHCDEDPAATLEGQLFISTTEDHSAFYTEDFTNNEDFGPADGQLAWVEETDGFPNTSQEYNATYDGQLHASSPTGTTNLVANGSVLLNGEASGAPDCLFAGAILVVS